MGRPIGSTKRSIINKHIGEGVTKMTEEVLKKFDEAFAIDLNIRQACDYADISERTYYSWVAKKPELVQRFDKFRTKLPIKAKYNIASKIHQGDVPLSERYLARKEPNEYGEKLKIEHSGSIAHDDEMHPEDEALRVEFRERLRENLQRRWREKQKQKNESGEGPSSSLGQNPEGRNESKS